MKKIFIKTLFILAAGTSLNAHSIYVDHEKGIDSNDGSKKNPFKTIKRGVRELKPGNTLFIRSTPDPYYESVVVKDLKGTPGKPVIIDGGMAVLSGARRLNPDAWQPVGDSLYKSRVPKGFRSKRYFMIINGKAQRMGTYYKLKRPPFKKVDQLKSGEWTYDDSEKALYVKVPPGITLNDISAPLNNPHSGVMIQGNCENIIVRNLIVENFINDGFNIHGNCKNIVFENITARNCGDDGLSAHGNCAIKVKNFISDGNPSAICHVDKATAEHENILIINTVGVNLLLLNAENSFRNLLVHAPGDISFMTGKNTVKNALFQHPGGKKPLLNIKTGDITFSNVMADAYRIKNKTPGIKLFSEKDKSGFDNSFVLRTFEALSELRKHSSTK